MSDLAASRYFDREFDLSATRIMPGEYYASVEDMLLVTVLGSCVSACISDPLHGIGGMNHFMLPGEDSGDPVSPSARYGAHAMEVLINHLLRLGAKKGNFEAKLFGGGNVLKGFTTTNIGEKNAEFVLDYLDNENIRVTTSDLLDIYPRKVCFFPRSGRALVKKLKKGLDDPLFHREREYASRLATSKIEGGIELFE